MIPSLQPTLDPTDVPAPPGFEPAEDVEWARLDRNVRSLPSRGGSTAQKVGIRYEKTVQEYLSERFGEKYLDNPWYSFRDYSGSRRCRPDGVLFTQSSFGRNLAVIFEIKIRHMPDAWWQLRRLYEPVVRATAQYRDIRLVEIVKEFDPSMPFPEVPVILETLDEVWLLKDFSSIGVFLWKR